jgi:predicted dehydrogenase
MIGTGSMGIFHMEYGIAGTPEIEIAAIADCVMFGQARGWRVAGEKPELKKHCYYDYRVMLEKEKDNIDAVVICTPFKTHYQMVMDCLDAGKYVFCEKTMAHTYKACRNIVKKCHETGKFVQCGHQRRYNPDFLHAMKLIQAGRMGRITSIEGHWHRNGDWRIPVPKTKDGTPIVMNQEEQKLVKDLNRHVNWRLYDEFATGIIGELSIHHIECANWIMGKAPSRVLAMGGLNYWRDDRDNGDDVTLLFEYDVAPGDRGFRPIEKRSEFQDPARLKQPYTVRLTWSGLLTNFYQGEGIMLTGDEGSIELHERRQVTPEQRKSTLHTEPLMVFLDPDTMQPTKDPERIKRAREMEMGARHSDRGNQYTHFVKPASKPFDDELDPGAFEIEPDARQFQSFVHHIKNGGKPRTNEMCGMMASVCDIAADEALKTKSIVKIDPAIWKFDFETPDPFELGV